MCFIPFPKYVDLRYFLGNVKTRNVCIAHDSEIELGSRSFGTNGVAVVYFTFAVFHLIHTFML